MCFSRRLVIVDRDPIRRHTFHSRCWLNNYSRRGQYGWFGSHTGRGQRRKLGLSVICNGGSALGCGRNTPTATRVMSSKPPEQDHASSLVMTALIQFESESYECNEWSEDAERNDRIRRTSFLAHLICELLYCLRDLVLLGICDLQEASAAVRGSSPKRTIAERTDIATVLVTSRRKKFRNRMPSVPAHNHYRSSAMPLSSRVGGALTAAVQVSIVSIS